MAAKHDTAPSDAEGGTVFEHFAPDLKVPFDLSQFLAFVDAFTDPTSFNFMIWGEYEEERTAEVGSFPDRNNPRNFTVRVRFPGQDPDLETVISKAREVWPAIFSLQSQWFWLNNESGPVRPSTALVPKDSTCELLFVCFSIYLLLHRKLQRIATHSNVCRKTQARRKI